MPTNKEQYFKRHNISKDSLSRDVPSLPPSLKILI